MLELWLPAFVLTVAIEAPIVALGTRRWLSIRRGLALGVALQVLTHPALWFLAPEPHDYARWVAASETVVALVEALGIALALRPFVAWRRALVRGLAVSLAANLVSTALGLALWRFLGAL